MLVRILHSFLNRTTNIIMDFCYKENQVDFHIALILKKQKNVNINVQQMWFHNF